MTCTCEASSDGCPRSPGRVSLVRLVSDPQSVARICCQEPPGPDYAAHIRPTKTAHEDQYHLDSLTRAVARFPPPLIPPIVISLTALSACC